MREIGIVAFILTLVWAYTELRIATPNCDNPTPNCKTSTAKDKVEKSAYDDD